MKALQVAHDVPLSDYSTMRLGGLSAFATSVESRSEVKSAHEWSLKHNVPIRLIGSGSNVVWRDTGYDGLLVINNIKHFEVFDEDETNTYITVGGGENWDSVVARAVGLGLTGIEALSLIPGTAGATPIQNVGAYGQDISQTLVSVEAYDTETKTYATLAASDCGFGYRTSRFKTTDSGRYMITGLTFHLTKGNPTPPFYAAVQSYFEKHAITDFTPQTVRDAVIAIRSAKLPDPRIVANNGSFFANPVIASAEFVQLSADYPEIVHWPAADSHIKLSAAWLIEQAGFKDYHDKETGMGTWATQPLVLVNEHAKSTADLLKFKQTIVDAVKAKFNVSLEQEPELLP